MDDFDKSVIRRKIAEAGFKTITAERWWSVCQHVKKLEAGQWARDNLCESEVRCCSSTLQKNRQVKKISIYCYGI